MKLEVAGVGERQGSSSSIPGGTQCDDARKCVLQARRWLHPLHSGAIGIVGSKEVPLSVDLAIGVLHQLQYDLTLDGTLYDEGETMQSAMLGLHLPVTKRTLVGAPEVNGGWHLIVSLLGGGVHHALVDVLDIRVGGRWVVEQVTRHIPLHGGGGRLTEPGLDEVAIEVVVRIRLLGLCCTVCDRAGAEWALWPWWL